MCRYWILLLTQNWVSRVVSIGEQLSLPLPQNIKRNKFNCFFGFPGTERKRSAPHRKWEMSLENNFDPSCVLESYFYRVREPNRMEEKETKCIVQQKFSVYTVGWFFFFYVTSNSAIFLGYLGVTLGTVVLYVQCTVHW